MQRRHSLIILLVVQLLAVLVLAQPARAADTGLLAGSVFVDENGNNLAEPQEMRVPGAVVHLRSQADPSLVITATVDASGVFVLRELPYGLYDVWASVGDQSNQRVITVEIAEVNAQVLLDIPVSAAVAGVSISRERAIFLPLVTVAN